MKVFLTLAICFIFLTGCSNNNNNNTAENVDYSSERLSISNTNVNVSSPPPSEPIEESLCSFSTKVSQKDPDRQTNITLACNSLNGIVVKAGETFSFCNTLRSCKT